MKINVLGKFYKLIETDCPACNDTYAGSTQRMKQTITVQKGENLAPDQYDETILHEVIHVVDEELKIGLTEESVARLAVGLYSAGCRVKVEK